MNIKISPEALLLFVIVVLLVVLATVLEQTQQQPCTLTVEHHRIVNAERH